MSGIELGYEDPAIETRIFNVDGILDSPIAIFCSTRVWAG
jgi:hypothetical protein